MMDVIDSWFYN